MRPELKVSLNNFLFLHKFQLAVSEVSTGGQWREICQDVGAVLPDMDPCSQDSMGSLSHNTNHMVRHPTSTSTTTSTTSLTSDLVTSGVAGLGFIEGDSFHGSKLSTEHISRAKNWLD